MVCLESMLQSVGLRAALILVRLHSLEEPLSAGLWHVVPANNVLELHLAFVVDCSQALELVSISSLVLTRFRPTSVIFPSRVFLILAGGTMLRIFLNRGCFRTIASA